MKKIVITPFLFVFILLTACSDEQLTRVDVQKVDAEGNDEDVSIITDSEILKEVNHSFEKIKWQPGVDVEMSRNEDVLAMLFYTFDENMPERLYEYRIWFNSGGIANIISNKESEGCGSLDKEDAEELKDNLLY